MLVYQGSTFIVVVNILLSRIDHTVSVGNSSSLGRFERSNGAHRWSTINARVGTLMTRYAADRGVLLILRLLFLVFVVKVNDFFILTRTLVLWQNKLVD